MDLYAAMEYLTTAAGCAAVLAAAVPLADRPPPGQRGRIGDPPTFARMCAILALLCGFLAFAIGVRLFGLAEVLTTLRFKGPMFLVVGAVMIGPLLLLSHGQRLEKQREISRRAMEAAANQAEESYRYDARQFRSAFLPFAAIVGGGCFYYATLLRENVKRLGPEGPLVTKLEYVAASLLFMLVFWGCGKLVYRLLFQLPAIANASGFFITDEALIQRAAGFGKDHCVPWEAIASIQPPGRPGGPYEIHHLRGVLRVPSYVLDREPLIAAILERSSNLEATPTRLLDSSGRAFGADPFGPHPLPASTVGMRAPLMRFVIVAIPFLIALSVEWSRLPWRVHTLPGSARIAIAAVPFVCLLLSGRGLSRGDQGSPWFMQTLSLVVMLHLCHVIERVIPGR